MTPRPTRIIVPLIGSLLAALFLPGTQGAETPPAPGMSRYDGLLGKAYNEPDFRRIKRVLEPLEVLEAHFDDGVGHGMNWSAVWEGYLIAPVSGPLTLRVTAHKPTTLDLFDRGSVTAEGTSEQADRVSLTVRVEKGETLPVKISYAHARGGLGGWRITWSYPGRPETSPPTSALFFDDRIADLYNWIPDPDPESVDFSRFATVDAHHTIVFYERGRATGWPANQGFFAWGNEMLQPYSKGYHLDRGLNHSIDPTRPGKARQARSTDGGETWREEPFVVEPPAPGDNMFPPDGFAFDQPGFALRNAADSNRFWFSVNRGKTWRGPYRWPDLGVGELTNRTDYVRLGDGAALLGFSVTDETIEAQQNDRAFFARFDGEQRTLSLVSWLTPPDDLARAVMSSTVRVGPQHFITAVRRKQQEFFEDQPPLARNWIEAFESVDGASSWRSLGEVAITDNGLQNGNPPSLVHLGGDALAVIYGYRAIPYTIRARLSHDLGRTWSAEIILRRDSTSWDMGYVRSALRPDGQVVSIYYLPTRERPELHLEATIWDTRTYQPPPNTPF